MGLIVAPSGLTPAEEARLYRLQAAEVNGERFDPFIRRVSPRHLPPRHIAPLIKLYERTRYERVFATIEIPPRHAKTTTALHALAWRLNRDPTLTHGFGTFGDDFAATRSRVARVLYRAGGGDIAKDAANLHEWRTTYGGGLIARGYNGEWTGKGIDGIALVDDPFKDRISAESKKIRQNVWEWFTDVLWLRLEGMSSVIVQHTRWHDDDLIGRLLAGKFAGYRWERYRLPAIAEDADDLLGRADGEALWPERIPAAELKRIQISIGPYSWASLFQQRPRPKGSDVFAEPGRFKLKDWKPDGHRILLCCDPAATEDTRADFSAIFVLAAKGFGAEMKVWLLHGWRGRVTVPALVRKIIETSREYYNAPCAIESVGAFKGVPQSMKEIAPDIRLRLVIPRGDKFTRAQPVAAAWNSGRVLVPLDAGLAKRPDAVRQDGSYPTWADETVDEATDFTGVSDEFDDQIDALAHGYNELALGKSAKRGARKGRNLPFG